MSMHTCQTNLGSKLPLEKVEFPIIAFMKFIVATIPRKYHMSGSFQSAMASILDTFNLIFQNLRAIIYTYKNINVHSRVTCVTLQCGILLHRFV